MIANPANVDGNHVKVGVAHGRFQPLHNEHLSYLTSSFEHCDYLIVAITNPLTPPDEVFIESDHRNCADANPFNFFIRSKIISKALLDVGVSPTSFSIVPFDLTRPEDWRFVLPPHDDVAFFVRVFSSWELQKIALFEQVGHKVFQIDKGMEKGMTATEVRDRIRSGKNFADLVPQATIEVLTDVYGSDLRNAV